MNKEGENNTFLYLEKSAKEIATFYLVRILRKETDYSSFEKRCLNRIAVSFSRLNNTEKRIIRNEFFYQDYPDWWEKEYKKEEFNLRKMESMHKFVNGVIYEDN